MPLSPSALFDQVEAAIQTRLNGGAVEDYTIRGRHLKYTSLTDLFTLRDQLRRETEAGTAGPFGAGYGVKDARLAT